MNTIAPALRMERFDGPAAEARLPLWAAAYEDVYAGALDLSDHNDPPIAERLERHCGRPGFELVAAFDGEDVAGFVYGYTLPADSLWWEGLTPEPDPEFVREHPGRTVGVCELLVGARWRRGNIGAGLLESFLAGRREERAAALVADGNGVVLDRYAAYGFTPVGAMEPYPGWRPHTMIVRSLR
ncbi:GNAT family N-acetyltransferase [Actinomadura macrotermitis]|uniref:GNAT family N-acetyltransferase n=1 Tax=Actinomadura macrotermitis TaxID=2585200 RepID=UPI0012962307|nr:GNAT family N-acetyltransferase [Actinomadura macrotermitis]